MAWYRIENTESGADLGAYEGTSEAEALEAFAVDAGYESYEEACNLVSDMGRSLKVTLTDGSKLEQLQQSHAELRAAALRYLSATGIDPSSAESLNARKALLDVLLAGKERGFRPTHRITVTPFGDKTRTYEVMLGSDGTARTLLEHAAELPASWKCRDGQWSWSGPPMTIDGTKAPKVETLEGPEIRLGESPVRSWESIAVDPKK